MNLQEIITLLHSTEWYQVDNTKEYLSKLDINLKYVIHDWESIATKEELPENIQNFRNQLVNRMIVNEFEKTKIVFSYGYQLLKTVNLYKFKGHLDGQKNQLRETYFAKPANRAILDSVEDDFHIALIRQFNTKETMGFVISSHPNI